MFNKKTFFLFFFIFFYFLGIAQKCDVKVIGNVYDEASKSPLAFVNILVQETLSGTTTDDDGNFSLENICPGHYHFIISHIGCEDEKFHFDITKDTVINIALSHTPTSLGTVLIEGQREDFDNQASSTVKRKVIEENSNKSLSDLLENESGVHLIKNGSGISKPVVHGMYGNRLLILNNGVMQSGQQWGNDHSPEIDPFTSDKIRVLKGANALEFGGGNLGSVVLTEPKKIEREPHLHGQVNYIFESNGRGNTLNTRLEKYSPILAWRLNGTLKKYGDRRSPNYFLNNTGVQEANLALQLEKSFNDKLFLYFYASTFNTEIGVLRGSHIGNLTDLEQALNTGTPFFTEVDFSNDINAPKQNVFHHLVKGKAKYFFNENQFLELTLAGQLNDRKEFDIRRSGRTDIPALSLTQYTYNSAIKYTATFENGFKLKLGNQNISTDNSNNPETGILPLIPDYYSWKSGLFSTLSKNKDELFYSFGLRYDYEKQKVKAISNSIPREIIRFENVFHNTSALFNLQYKFKDSQTLGWNIGYAMRNPGINELYSNGLHQGVSGIEEGDPGLKMESALKNTLEYKFVPSSDFAFNVLAYHHFFNDYIFLDPQDEIRLTIRGAFPVFKYEQTDATIYGLDVSTQFTIGRSILGLIKYSFLRGMDVSNDVPLVFMPPNSFFGSLTYRTPKTFELAKNIKLEDSEIEITNRYVFEQKNILANQDFVLPPEAYNLLGLKLSSYLFYRTYKVKLFFKAENIFNVNYRDYLNRQRYFSDDLGSSLTIGMNIKF